MTIKQFAQEYNLRPRIERIERGIQRDVFWTFQFDGDYLVSNGHTIGCEWGEARTPYEAMCQYSRNISGKKLLAGEFREGEHLMVPILTDKPTVLIEWPEEGKVYE